MEMIREDDDVHYCLRCKTAISGLENYIAHRQQNCQKNKKSLNDPCDSTQQTTCDTHNDISYSCNNDVDLHNASDFFSSLELKCNVTDSYNVSSKKLSTDLFPMTFEYDSDNYTETENGFYPPQSHTGGKWGPSNSLLLLSPNPNPFVSSRYTALMPEHNNEPTSLTTEMNQEPIVPEISNEPTPLGAVLNNESIAPDLNNETTSLATELNRKTTELELNNEATSSESVSTCSKINDVNFEDKEMSNRQLVSHFCNIEEAQTVIVESEETNPDNEKEPSVHSLSEDHKKKSSEKKVMNQEQEPTKVFPFQCCICQFFCLEKSELITHVEAEEHLKKVTHLRHSLYCLPCKFETFDNKEILSHLLSEDHSTISSQNGKNYHPVMVIEKTNRFYCKYCNGKCAIITDEGVSGTPAKIIFHCPHCEFNCKSNSILKCHICKAHQGSAREESCIKKNTIENKIKKNKNCRNICFSCSMSFKNVTELKQHFKSEHSAQTLNCNKCNRLFMSEDELQNHYQSKMHQTNLTRHVLQDEYNVPFNTNETYKCDRCSFDTKSKAAMCLHSIQHEGPISDLKNEENGKPLNVYLCPFCSKEFTRFGQLEIHVYTHTGEKPYVCKVCHKGFTQKSAKNIHENQHPNPDAIWNCKSCPFQTSKKTILDRHKLTHNKNRTLYVCDVCGANFTNLNVLALHTKRHVNKKKYECRYEGCADSFWTSEEMQWHSKSHIEKEFLCEICAYTSKSKSLLTRHQRIHTREQPYHCDICPHLFANISNLIRHKRLHTNVKNYSCPYCDYSCNTSENIKKHITKTKKHEGLKMYPCLFCNYSTNESMEFTQHMTTTHSQDMVDDAQDDDILSFIYSAAVGQNNNTTKEFKKKILPKPSNEKPLAVSNENGIFFIQQPQIFATTSVTGSSQPNLVLLPNCIAGSSILLGLPAKNTNVTHSSLTPNKKAKLEQTCASTTNLTIKEANTSKLVPLRPKGPVLNPTVTSLKTSQPLLLPKFVPGSNQIILTLNNNQVIPQNTPVSRKRKIPIAKVPLTSTTQDAKMVGSCTITCTQINGHIKPQIIPAICNKEKSVNVIIIDSDEEVIDIVGPPKTVEQSDSTLTPTSETLLSAMKATLGAEVMQMDSFSNGDYQIEDLNSYVAPTHSNPLAENVKLLNQAEAMSAQVNSACATVLNHDESEICIFFDK